MATATTPSRTAALRRGRRRCWTPQRRTSRPGAHHAGQQSGRRRGRRIGQSRSRTSLWPRAAAAAAALAAVAQTARSLWETALLVRAAAARRTPVTLRRQCQDHRRSSGLGCHSGQQHPHHGFCWPSSLRNGGACSNRQLSLRAPLRLSPRTGRTQRRRRRRRGENQGLPRVSQDGEGPAG